MMEELYATNEDFRGYVDRYAKHHGISPEEALKHSMVRSYAGQWEGNVENGQID